MDDLNQFYVVQEQPNCLVLSRNDQLYVYKEFAVPRRCGTEDVSAEWLCEMLERRRELRGEGVLVLERVVFTQEE